MKQEKYVVVVGGLNMDLAGISGPGFKEGDSNIGTIKLSEGGVGQNIAQNLVKLNVPVYLVTTYGDDYFGEILSAECQKKSISLEYAEQLPGKRSSTYLYVTNSDGDMVVGINDMDIINHITPEFLRERIDFINNAAVCVIDGNIPKQSVEWLAEHCQAPIFVDPVSVAKVGRFENVLDKIDTFKPNAIEAEYLTGIKITDEATAKKAAQHLIDQGVKNVFISLGSLGILCASQNEMMIVPILSTKIVSANGAGDCTMATITWARHHFGASLPLIEVGQFTQSAASITLESAHSVSPELTVTNVIRRAQRYLEKEAEN
ncbi:PfkB family carbohydrate kinase [Bacillus sp. FJAT-18017]|uniref:PfkB family carbohydrate kinase n=1 Tax=Bacillus sp. FJAT-18017 TaxID=1705566 RepID=UPI0009EBD950|nr:PfkB family carbohydrate kinase [Bacillus sp. FJAT-18017]